MDEAYNVVSDFLFSTHNPLEKNYKIVLTF